MATIITSADQRTQAIHESLTSLIGADAATKALENTTALDVNKADWY